MFAGYQNGFWLIHIVDGYTFVTVLVVFNLACSGLLVSYIMKYADSIMKVRMWQEACFALSPALYNASYWLLEGVLFVPASFCSLLVVRTSLMRLCVFSQVYATSMAMLVTMAVSILLFNLTMTLQLFLGIVITSCSVVLYYVPPATLAQVHSPTTSAKAVLPR